MSHLPKNMNISSGVQISIIHNFYPLILGTCPNFVTGKFMDGSYLIQFVNLALYFSICNNFLIRKNVLSMYENHNLAGKFAIT